MRVRWLVWLGWAWGALAQADALSPRDFFGEYIGSSHSDGERARDLNVTIRPYGSRGGFSVEWVTVVHKRDGRITRKTYRVPFEPSAREQIYSAAMRTTVFGGKSGLDPLAGEPLFWARIQQQTLTVTAFMIDDEGNYVVQVYRRTLTPKGLHLSFERNHGGEPRVALEAELVRVAD